MAFEVPPLPYGYDALEPTIDEQTMRLHHDKHHQAYVTNANAALEGTEWADRTVEQVPDRPGWVSAAASEMLEVELVVLDTADREGEIDLQSANVGEHLVNRVRIHA